jgi:hypothetical protein
MLAENEGIMKSVQAEDDYTAVETCSWLMWIYTYLTISKFRGR